MWEILHLAAIEGGDSIWPEVFPLSVLEKKRREMGTALFECMYMGRPEALRGDVFDPRWFGAFTLKPLYKAEGQPPVAGVAFTDASGEAREFPLEELITYQFWDLAISSKQTADYTCCVTVAIVPQTMDLLVLDVSRGHWTFDVTQKKIVELGHLWNPLGVGIESVAYQAAAVQQAAMSSLLPIQEVKVDRDKVTRARLPAARAEAGKVFLLLGAPWLGFFTDELASFPTGVHDDTVDALSGAIALAAAYTPARFELFGSPLS